MRTAASFIAAITYFEASANLFYQNDLEIVVSIFLRGLRDLPSDDEAKIVILQCIFNMLSKSGFQKKLKAVQKQIAEAILQILESEDTGEDIRRCCEHILLTHGDFLV
eukprot:TRINITY_DN2624_c0_g1_i1.p1 TRINITY_DN2624_c0_g1~~TRINITY_DN2624_c0_g1_i1.p1  ORF type:complete len:108 (+),score=24.33 TRINITY_DN2624_c0_g1_i1:107-430(+)